MVKDNKEDQKAKEARFGQTELPDEQEEALHQAKKLEWWTIAYYVFDATVLFLVLGNSQAMKSAWVQDLLAFLPPIAFLIAVKVAAQRPTQEHPYGLHRSVGIAHLVAASALFSVGAFLLFSSASTLIKVEHPSVGGIELFGQTIWLGWLMLVALVITGIIPVVLGIKKMKLASKLHDKVLYADAEMNRADWMTTIAAIVGVVGIGFGLWWVDAAAAILISLDVLHDGVKNLRGAVSSLVDTRAKTYDGSKPDPLGSRIDAYLEGLDWVTRARSRIRDEGHVYHIESFVVPVTRNPSLDSLEAARGACIRMDWKVQDLTIIPVKVLPEEFLPGLKGPNVES